MSDVVTHEASASVTGDSGRAFDAAVVALTSAGFKLEHKFRFAALFTAVPMTRSNRHPLLGASRIKLTFHKGRLSAVAELGGVARLARSVRMLATLTFLGGGLATAIVFYFAFGAKTPAVWAGPALFIAVDLVFVFVLCPAVARRLEERTKAALDTLLTNSSGLGADA